MLSLIHIYTYHGDNYFNADMDYRIAREKSQGINQYVTETLDRLAGTLNVELDVYKRQNENYILAVIRHTGPDSGRQPISHRRNSRV